MQGDPKLFEATHARVKTMLAQGQVDGLRIDHPDGLRDPLGYFKRLRALLPRGRLYVEKILENSERLDEDWPIDGTVGYDFLDKVNRLWMDDRRIDALTATYSDFTGHPVNFAALAGEEARYPRISRIKFLRGSRSLGRSGPRDCPCGLPNPRFESAA